MRWVLVFAAASSILSGCLGNADDRCGPDQVSEDGSACVCALGYVPADDGPGCAPCPEERLAADGTCTSTTTARRPDDAPTGLAEPCATPEDCAGHDASYCDTFHYDQCLIPGCDLEQDDCPDQWECCDLSLFGVEERLCVRANECPTR